jgi:hypothetical protein
MGPLVLDVVVPQFIQSLRRPTQAKNATSPTTKTPSTNILPTIRFEVLRAWSTAFMLVLTVPPCRAGRKNRHSLVILSVNTLNILSNRPGLYSWSIGTGFPFAVAVLTRTTQKDTPPEPGVVPAIPPAHPPTPALPPPRPTHPSAQSLSLFCIQVLGFSIRT